MNRSIPFFAALFILLPRVALCDTVPQLFNAGVNEYRQGNYDRAAEIFLDVYDKYGVSSPDVLVNLGSAEFAAGRVGPALTHLQKAVRLAPQSRAGQTAEVNLDRIRSLLNERQKASDNSAYVFGSYTDAWTAMFSWLDPTTAVICFLACWSLFFLALAFRRSFGRTIALTITGVTLALTMVTAVGAYASSRIDGYRTGVVLADQTPLVSDISSTEPSANLPEGLEFRVLEVRGTWVNIRLSSGLTGWIPESDAGIP